AEFMEGVLAVPQFVLHELQMVADSSDSLKRQRGRRGLEVLQRIQKMPQVEVRILEEDGPQAGDVDHKLVELARRTGAKIVTNDFNLNKVATVQGFSVLNVNQLAHALKPAVRHAAGAGRGESNGMARSETGNRATTPNRLQEQGALERQARAVLPEPDAN